MRRKAILCLISALALCTSFAMAEQFEVMFYDSTGTLIENVPAAVMDSSGNTLQKLAPAPDGVYTINAEFGQKLAFRLEDPALGNLNKREHRFPLQAVGPIAIQMPGDESPSPNQAPANDNCETPQAIAIPSVTPGSTLAATIEPLAIPDCPTPGGIIEAPGVWYSVNGNGNTLTASTCELNSPGSADYDTKITVYCKGCNPATCVNSNDDTADGGFCGFTFHSTVSWGSQVLPGPNFYGILVHGFGGSVGNFNLSLASDAIPAVPTVDCLPPPVTGGCCVEDCHDPVFGHCELLTPANCTAAGGVYLGDNSACFIATGESSTWSSSPNAPIPDNNPAGVVDTITVSDSFAVAKVEVDVNLQHTWIGDIRLRVTSPAGKTTNMWDRRCGNTDNMDFLFSDTGSDTSCAVVAAAGTGAGMPTVAGLGPALAQFNGDQANGDWSLNIDDNVATDSGTLLNWSLIFQEGNFSCAFCGDGTVGGSEECDDGNTVSGDGCSATCVIEVADEDEDSDHSLIDETFGVGTGPNPNGVFNLTARPNNSGPVVGPGTQVPGDRQRLGRRLPRR
jgi:cysteine-rich repeat protein